MGQLRPQDYAALSHSTVFKLPALPEVADRPKDFPVTIMGQTRRSALPINGLTKRTSAESRIPPGDHGVGVTVTLSNTEVFSIALFLELTARPIQALLEMTTVCGDPTAVQVVPLEER
jgi:hypothetical protein